MKLHDYWRSSAAYRVRIALNLKGLRYEHLPVNLSASDEATAAYRALNPQGLVPTLVDAGLVLTQSLAICEYLEETHPEPALLPAGPADRARVRAVAQAIACDIHPLNNLRVLTYLVRDLGIAESDKLAWYRHWIAEGLAAVEISVAGETTLGRFCHGNQPTLADVCLIPQLYNARRFDCELAAYPTLVRIETACLALPAFDSARPERQPDAR